MSVDIKNLFGVTVRHIKDRDGRKVTIYGYTRGKYCKDCVFFYKEQHAKAYNRCAKVPNKHWRAMLDACILFEEKNKR